MRPPLRLPLLLTLALVVAGCAARDQEAIQTGGDIVPGPHAPTPGPLARFVVDSLVVLAPDGEGRGLYEDDGHALVRYVVRQPDDAPAQTAFVVYTLNGRVVEAQNVRLEPGQSKEYERRVEGLRTLRAIDVEVRASASVARAQASVAEWPRHGEPLDVGPVTARVDYGLKERDGRVLVNVTLVHDGTPVHDFRVKMLCADAEGAITPTPSTRVALPPPGEEHGVDVVVDDCPGTRYGLELKADGPDGASHWGRILLVPPGWAP